MVWGAIRKKEEKTIHNTEKLFGTLSGRSKGTETPVKPKEEGVAGIRKGNRTGNLRSRLQKEKMMSTAGCL